MAEEIAGQYSTYRPSARNGDRPPFQATQDGTQLVNGSGYEAVAAGQTDQVLGATGAIGDYLAAILIQPGTTSPGAVVVKDGVTTIWTFPGGASSVGALYPFPVPFGIKSVNGAWTVTTGADVTVLASGSFT